MSVRPLPDALPRPRIAALYDIWAGGTYGTPEERALAEQVAAVAPATPPLVRAARAYHAQAAAGSAAGAAGLIAVPAGFPDSTAPIHASLGGQRLLDRDGRPLRVVLADPDDTVINAIRERIADRDGRITAVRAELEDPGRLLRKPEVQEITKDGPVQLHIPVILSWVDSRTCARILNGFARRLPPGSVIVGSTSAGETTPLGRQWEDLTADVGQLQRHAPEDVAAWCKYARLQLDEDPADVRAHGLQWAHEELGQTPASTGRRMLGFTARVPHSRVSSPEPARRRPGKFPLPGCGPGRLTAAEALPRILSRAAALLAARPGPAAQGIRVVRVECQDLGILHPGTCFIDGQDVTVAVCAVQVSDETGKILADRLSILRRRT